MKTLDRRDFIKYTVGGLAAVVVGSKLASALKKQGFAATPHHQQQHSAMVWKTKVVVSEL